MSASRALRPFRGRGAAALAIAAVAFAFAYMGQDDDGGSRSHYALVKALAAGTPIIDETRFQVGDVPPSDVVVYDGHFYSNKAPGLAFLTVPLFVALDAAGVRTTGDPSRMIWALGLLGNVLPAIVLLLLVHAAAERVAPGFGAATAVTLGLGTLVLPFATTFYAHVLVATLLFGSFVLLWRERERSSPRVLVFAAAGLLAGLAITSEYSSAIAAGVLGAYALFGGGRRAAADAARRALAYAVGVVVGVVPLLAFNAWAFGSIFHLSYFGDPPPGGDPRGTVEGGVGFPSFRTAVSLLLWKWGLVTATPVVVAAAVGIWLLYRRGLRTEAGVVASITTLYFVFNSALAWPFGGAVGARYLLATLPFLALGLALAYRTAPLTTAALALPSVAAMVVVTAAKHTWEGDVTGRLLSVDGSAETVADVLSITGWYAIVPYYAAVVAAGALTVAATRVPVRRDDAALAAASLAAWGVVFLVVPEILARGELGVVGALAALAVAVAAGLAVAGVRALAISLRTRTVAA